MNQKHINIILLAIITFIVSFGYILYIDTGEKIVDGAIERIELEERLQDEKTAREKANAEAGYWQVESIKAELARAEDLESQEEQLKRTSNTITNIKHGIKNNLYNYSTR